jgi:hypothetical protein
VHIKPLYDGLDPNLNYEPTEFPTSSWVQFGQQIAFAHSVQLRANKINPGDSEIILILYVYISMTYYKSLILIFVICKYVISSHAILSFSIKNIYENLRSVSYHLMSHIFLH